MIGIVSLGCYLPRYRLTGETLASAWGGSKSGARSVANHDEDSLTMAAEAVFDCLAGRDLAPIGRLFFASTSAPYLEHQNASIIAAVADLRRDALTADLGGSLRASASALRLAHDAVKADGGQALIAAADLRLVPPGDPAERTIGDGGAAVLIGSDDPLAVFKGFYSTNNVFIDYWRRPGETYVSAGDAKFISDVGIMALLPQAVNAALDRFDVAKNDVAAVVYYCPDARARRGLDKKLGFPPAAYLDQADPQAKIGDAGNAQLLLGLIAALERSKAGDLILLAGFGAGIDVALLEVTPRGAGWKSTLANQLDAGRPLASYARYLQFRKILPVEHINVWASPAVLWREEKVNLRLEGGKCEACGMVNFPPRPICYNCDSKEMAPYRISKRGEVFTFTLDSLIPNPEAFTPMVSVDLEGGGRLYAQMSDVASADVKIGMKVEMVFRKLHEGGGFNHYFWKFRPVLEAGAKSGPAAK